MAKYKKFVFPELPKRAVANFRSNQASYSNGQEELINIAVAQHFNNIVNAEEIEKNEMSNLQEELEKKK